CPLGPAILVTNDPLRSSAGSKSRSAIVSCGGVRCYPFGRKRRRDRQEESCWAPPTPSPVTRTPSLCQGPLHVTESALETVTRNEAFPGRSHFRLMPDRGGSKPQPEALRHLSASAVTVTGRAFSYGRAALAATSRACWSCRGSL